MRNTLYHSSLGMSPFECQYGFPPPPFPGQEPEVDVPAATQLFRRCRCSWKRACIALLRAVQQQWRQANWHRRAGPTLRPGQRVWLSIRDLPLRVESRKLAPRYIGLFKILKKINPVSNRRLLPRSMKIHPTFHVSHLKLVVCSTLSPARKPLPCTSHYWLASQLTQSADCWILNGSMGRFNIMWIGRALDQRHGPGFLFETF